jgi:uncharacterized coiled-coil DUF342 family protein
VVDYLDSLDELADERDRLRDEEKNILSDMAQIRAKLSKIRPELQDLRKSRDELNETVRALKKSRDELRDSSRRSLVSLRDLLKLTHGTDEGSRAEREMADLEWTIMTSSLEKDEEKLLLNKVRRLETKVGAHRKTKKLFEEVSKHRADADDIHNKIQELAAQSQQYHEEVVSLSEGFDKLREKQDELRRSLEDVRAKSLEIGSKYTLLRNSTLQSEKVSQKAKEKAFKENLKEAAKKKLDKGGKVSLEELTALMGEEEE